MAEVWVVIGLTGNVYTLFCNVFFIVNPLPSSPKIHQILPFNLTTKTKKFHKLA